MENVRYHRLVSMALTKYGCNVLRDRNARLNILVRRCGVQCLGQKNVDIIFIWIDGYNIPGKHSRILDESQLFLRGSKDTCRNLIRMIIRNEVYSTRGSRLA